MYAITDTGRDVAREWLREMLRNTEGDYPEFVAAVSILFGLPPEEAQAELELRAEKLEDALAAGERDLRVRRPGCRACSCSKRSTARRCLRPRSRGAGVIDDLRTGRLTWSQEWLRELAARFLPADDQQPEEDS